MSVTPYKNSSASKKNQVADMFNNISNKYDFLNHFLSFGIDKYWRKAAINKLKPYKPDTILDIATGTADFAIEAVRLNPEKITGIDISVGMLDAGKKKISQKNLTHIIRLMEGDAERLDFDAHSFDACMAAFGVRNFENLEMGLQNIYRVLKPGGVILILEFSQPVHFPIAQLYGIYFKYILPLWGNIISQDSSAYTYLPKSVSVFPFGNDFIKILEKTGFKNCRHIPLTFGISTIYMGEKH
ncbi:MAG: bifunctional demethylmenaquinone methyltransferase/2-methoxy-6-polyprenyl-1,4-benzoquinol methylase UbiE [Cytophagales bacterium]|nr:bifunctional demethylmenaquinone methyltransferase/2-methoxy-6-polyprenyl-1,4-benzoquinol methylase UbiE [Cytophagales bacterium]